MYDKDPLTNLPKKAEFEDLLAQALAGDGAEAPVSVAKMDIDAFLLVNEKHGHAKGDDVIQSIARHFADALGLAQLCRIGGDEFAIILPRTEKEAAFLLLEQARQGVPRLAGMDGIDPRPTVSLGLATWPDDGSTRQEIIRKADDALFRAKSGGKNRVALAREEKKVPKTSHYTQGQLDRLAQLALKEDVGEAELLREALDDLLKKYSS